jgi:DNA (cytosine-5)-methyltransferase 1
MKSKTITAVDLFCGAGGATNALLQACKQRGYKLKITGINHWALAIKTHSANHEYAEHLCADINEVDPLVIVPSGKLDILMAGVECIFFSTARGGKPINNQRRSTGWKVLEWAEKLHIKTIIIENVPEFKRWGPLYTSGPKKDKPIKKYEGQIFLAFVNALKAMGYTVDYRILCAADFGDPTTRERFFLISTRGRHKPHWPDRTHSKDGGIDIFGTRLKKWVPVKKIIDWEDKGISIFNRELYGKKPLVDNTMRRIYAGMIKFWSLPFVLPPEGFHRGNQPRSVDDALQTVTSRGAGYIVQPFIVMQNGTTDGQIKVSNRSIEEPAPTLTAVRHLAVVEPFVIPQQSCGQPRSVTEPLPTVSSAGAIGLIEPFIFSNRGGDDGYLRSGSINDPLGTLTTSPAECLIEPFLISAEHVSNGDDSRVHSGQKPMPTLTAKSDFGVVQPYLVSYHGGEQGDRRTESVDDPMGTLDTANRRALVQPFLVQYNGTGGPESVDDPLNTVVAKARHSLVTPEWVKDLPPGYKLLYIPGIGLMDVRHRMLRPRECARAHSFADSYTFLGNQDDQMRMIGNSWPVKLGAAICGAQLDSMAEG